MKTQWSSGPQAFPLAPIQSSQTIAAAVLRTLLDRDHGGDRCGERGRPREQDFPSSVSPRFQEAQARRGEPLAIVAEAAAKSFGLAELEKAKADRVGPAQSLLLLGMRDVCAHAGPARHDSAITQAMRMAISDRRSLESSAFSRKRPHCGWTIIVL